MSPHRRAERTGVEKYEMWDTGIKLPTIAQRPIAVLRASRLISPASANMSAAPTARKWMPDEICHGSPIRGSGKGRPQAGRDRQFDRGSPDGRIYIELINGPFLFGLKATPDEFLAGLDRAIERGWLALHESGTHVKFTKVGAELFA